jgi:murein tripeptide amidase MpaA
MHALPTPRFDHFYRHDPLTALLRSYAEAAPNLVQLRSLGKSWEGRDIWLLVLTNTATGADIDKPAFWVDGNIHAAELTASTACLYWLHALVKAYAEGDVQTRQLLDTRAVYMVPRLNPDGAELALADRPRHIRSSTRPYPYDEEPVDGLTIEDADGDGRVLQMRIPDPHGPYKKHPDDPRLMIAREPGEFGGSYYRIVPEGTLTNYDGVKITANKDKEGRRRPLPHQRARGARDGGLRHPPPEHRRRGQLPHPQRRDPAPDGHAER